MILNISVSTRRFKKNHQHVTNLRFHVVPKADVSVIKHIRVSDFSNEPDFAFDRASAESSPTDTA